MEAVTERRRRIDSAHEHELLSIFSGSNGADVLNPYRGPSGDDQQRRGSAQSGPLKPRE